MKGEPDDLGPMLGGQSRIYRSSEGDVTLAWRTGSKPSIEIATIGRDATAPQSPALEAWVRAAAAGPGVREVWTGQWDLGSGKVLDRVRRAFVEAGAIGRQVRRHSPPAERLAEAWRRFVAHPRAEAFDIEWPKLHFEGTHSHDRSSIEVVTRRGPQYRPVAAWQRWVDALPPELRRTRPAPGRETYVQLPVGHASLPVCIDIAIAVAAAKPVTAQRETYRIQPSAST